MPTPVKLDALTDTWTDSGTTYQGIYLDVTDTASAAGSLLQRLDTGTSEKFGVDINGYVRIGGSVVLQRSGTTTTLGTSSDTALVGYGAFSLNNTGNASLTLKADTDANSAAATADILFDNNNGTTVGRIRWDEASTTLNLGYGANNHLSILSSGNIGIGTGGTTGPENPLDLWGGSGGTFLAIRDNRSTTGDLAGIKFSTAAGTDYTSYKSFIAHIETGSNGLGDLIFCVDPDSTASAATASDELLRISANSNVSVGYGVAPPNKLTVKHDEATNTWSSVSDASTDAVVKILGSNNATPYGLYLGYANSANNAQGIQAGDGTSALPLVLNPLGGNLGIGTSAPSRKLHVSDADNVYAAFSRTGATASALVVGAESGKNRIYSWTTPGGSTASPLEIVMGDTTAFTIDSSGNAGFGTSAPNANALLDLTSTTKAFMPPRMTTTQKNAIASPTAGMVVYDSTLSKLAVYTGSAWETVTSA